MRVPLVLLLLVAAVLGWGCPEAGPADPSDVNMIVALSIEGLNRLANGSIPVLESQISSMKFDDIETDLDLV
ncbi:hypothetical protein KIPB_002384, partial [Kipferlia bialata]|eukprot:g2384.t1